MARRKFCKNLAVLRTNAEFLWESVIKTLPKIASKFLFKSLRCKLSYQLPILISLRMGIKSQIEN